VPEGCGKALDLDTPLATPSGWTTMGAVQAGEEVLGSDGRPVRVVGTSKVMLGHRCFEVTFSDGASVVADAEHLWTVEDGNCRWGQRTYTTEHLARTFRWPRGVCRYRVPTVAREGRETELPIDPYVLGVWLGDGETAGARITNMDPEVWDRIHAAGYEFGASYAHGRASTRGVLGLRKQLRELGVLGAKRIPEAYLLSSVVQRQALMQGLIDSDGYVSKAGGVVLELNAKAEALVEDVRQLAWSLGRPCYAHERAMVVNGAPYPVFGVRIACDARHGLAHLPRKAARMKPQSWTADHRRITDVRELPSRPVRCIAVDAPDSLYLAGEALVPTHNTTLISLVALYGADYTETPWIPVAASAAKQATIIFQQAAGFVRRTPGMGDRFECLDGIKLIRSLRNPGPGIQVFAHDPATGDGVIPAPWALLDELHRHPDMRLWELWAGKLRKRNAQVIGISTAGEPETPFELLRDEVRRRAKKRKRNGSHLRAESPGEVLHEWMVPADEACTDMEAVKAANPLSLITPATLAEDFALVTNLGDWKRLKPLAVDTPIPTPEGWTTMGAIEVGDEVLNGEGLPTTVEAVTPVRLEQAYELTFSDGASIVASGDHEWEVEDARSRHRQVVRTTQELADSLYMDYGRGRWARWRVRLVGRHASPSAELPIDPYVLGVWLGDGDTRTGRITNADPEVWTEVEARGYEVGSIAPSMHGRDVRVQTLLGLRTLLRQERLLKNKHIPPAYLVAPEHDRWELLQGLVDSDGTVSEDGRVLFANANARLAADVQRLAWSLGRPCIRRERRAVLDGVDHGLCFVLEIPCDVRHPIVRLPRKAARLRLKGKTADHRRIKSIVPVGDELVRCISVAAADSIFLAGDALIPTHNCNRPTRSITSAVSDREWEDAEVGEEIPARAQIDLGVDVAWKWDTFAIVPLHVPRTIKVEQPNGTVRDLPLRLLGAPAILTPPRDGSSLHPDEVKTAFLEFHSAYAIGDVVMDMGRAEDIAAWLEDELGVRVIDRTQSNVMAVEDYNSFMDGLRNGTLKHTGDLGLKLHVLHAIARRLPGGDYRFDRPSAQRGNAREQDRRVIDALTAASFVVQHSTREAPKKSVYEDRYASA
jgi:hypothetical protein